MVRYEFGNQQWRRAKDRKNKVYQKPCPRYLRISMMPLSGFSNETFLWTISYGPYRPGKSFAIMNCP